MPLSPYFLQGSSSEQRLVQDLINEQLKIYGQDVVYLPRKIVNKKTMHVLVGNHTLKAMKEFLKGLLKE